MLLINKSLAGKKTILPIMGEVEIAEDGSIEIEDQNLCDSLLQMSQWESNNSDEVISKDEDPISKDESSGKELIAKIDILTLPELVEMASMFPEEEWLKFSQNTSKPEKLMAVYLKKKLKGKK